MCFAIDNYFFVQAEDGIRDLVRSRGLGDVYKRQVRDRREVGQTRRQRPGLQPPGLRHRAGRAHRAAAVSYTHLTLPTSDLV